MDELSGAVTHILADAEGARELQQARTLFEALLVRYAAEHASNEDIVRLKEALDANHSAIGNQAEFGKTDVAFHQVLAEIPKNSIFTSLQAAVAAWLAEQRFVSLRMEGAEQAAYDAHRAIYEAIAAHDPNAAERAMNSHLNKVGDYYWSARHDNSE